jgi:hypothetical protein
LLASLSAQLGASLNTEECRMDAEAHSATATSLAGASAVSWSAILAGTAAAIATSLLLFALAAGLDLASISARPRYGIATGSLTVMAAIAMIVTQWVASCVGGYITGRLRTRWVSTHTHEVFFRDTAHGFITWCLATIVIASGVLSSASPLLRMSATGEEHSPRLASSQPNRARFLQRDSLQVGVRVGSVQPSAPPPERPPVQQSQQSLPGELVLPPAPSAIGEAAPIVLAGAVPIVVAGEAVDDPAQLAAPDDPDAAVTKAAATGSILTALSMLIGAFIASVSAAVGGRLRDLHP